QVNTSPPVIIPFPGGMMPGFIDSLPVQGVLLQNGDNVIRAWSILPGDVNTHNDTQAVAVHRFYHKGLPFSDDYEGGDYWFAPGVLSNWERGTPSGAIINTAWSGTNTWGTRLDGPYGRNASDYLYSPVFDFSSLASTDTVVLSFAHWIAVANWDYGHVESSVDSGMSWGSVGYYLDTNGTNWYNNTNGGVHYFTNNNSGWMSSSYKLNPALFSGHPAVQFRFHFHSSQMSTSDGWAIDNFSLSLPPATDDIGVTDLIHPSTDTVAGSLIFPRITVTNFGTATQSTIPLEIKLNGSPVINETWTGTLSPNGSITHTFSQSFVVPLMPYEVCATSNLSGDQYPGNDQYCNMFNGVNAENDAGVIRILTPVTDASGNICFYEPQAQPWYQYDMQIRLKNYGRNILSSIPVQYSFDNGTTSWTDFWSGSLLPGDSTDITLTQPFLPVFGPQSACAETALQGDAYHINDKVCKAYSGVLCTGFEPVVADQFMLEQNIPNPAHEYTTIHFSTPSTGKVKFKLQHISGVEVYAETLTVEQGKHTIPLNVNTLPSGIYLYMIEFRGQRLIRKMVVTH
ncbi:MAG: T9SS type A sorting domain-containing protein, partial [Bacteroidales bacterium]